MMPSRWGRVRAARPRDWTARRRVREEHSSTAPESPQLGNSWMRVAVSSTHSQLILIRRFIQFFSLSQHRKNWRVEQTDTLKRSEINSHAVKRAANDKSSAVLPCESLFLLGLDKRSIEKEKRLEPRGLLQIASVRISDTRCAPQKAPAERKRQGNVCMKQRLNNS